jgi:prevent-host-death family protein
MSPREAFSARKQLPLIISFGKIIQNVYIVQIQHLSEDEMTEVISSSQLRSEIKRVLNEVGYGQSQYIIERFGEPTAALISIDDLRLLQAAKQKQGKASLQQTIDILRARSGEVDSKELDNLIEEARTDFYEKQNLDKNA